MEASTSSSYEQIAARRVMSPSIEHLLRPSNSFAANLFADRSHSPKRYLLAVAPRRRRRGGAAWRGNKTATCRKALRARRRRRGGAQAAAEHHGAVDWVIYTPHRLGFPHTGIRTVPEPTQAERYATIRYLPLPPSLPTSHVRCADGSGRPWTCVRSWAGPRSFQPHSTQGRGTRPSSARPSRTLN